MRLWPGSSAHRRAFRALRDEFDAFPNVRLSALDIGKVGLYDNRDCTFSWRTDLDTIGVTRTRTTHSSSRLGPSIVNSYYTFGEETEVAFSGGDGSTACANIGFGDRSALVMQGIGLSTVEYDLQQLEAALNEAIAAGIGWDRDWVVVTQVTVTEACTLLYSASNKASTTISTQTPVGGDSFNLADVNLGLSVTRSKGNMLSYLAQRQAVPLFLIHKLKGWDRQRLSRGLKPEGRLRLELYGRHG